MSTFNSIRTSAFNSISTRETKDLSKTKLCMYFKVGCPNIDTCTFAHVKEELKPTMCRFAKTCRKPDCWFFHPGDNLPSTEDLLVQAMKGMKFIEKKEPKIEKKPVWKTPKMTQRTELIISIEEDDEYIEIDDVVSQKVEKVEIESPKITSQTYVPSNWNELVETMKVDDKPLTSIQSQPIVERKMRVQFEAEMTTEEMMEIMTYLRTRKMNPTIVSLK